MYLETSKYPCFRLDIVYWFQQQIMIRNKVQKSLPKDLSILTPWDTEVDDTCINRYCSDYVTKIVVYNETRTENNFPKISDKKRAISQCRTQPKVDTVSNIQKYNANKTHYRSQMDNYVTFHTLSQHKTERPQKKKMENRKPLQELNVKNFIIQGGQPGMSQKQKQVKKKQCSYIMKQKFAELRRSTKMIDQNKQNTMARVIRFQV